MKLYKTIKDVNKKLFEYIFLFIKDLSWYSFYKQITDVLFLAVVCFIVVLFQWVIEDIYYYLTNKGVIGVLIMIISVVLAAGYTSLLERQLVAIIQQRTGPSFVGGLGGILQPLSDGFKLLIKELIVPTKSKVFIFLLAPAYTFTLSIALWAYIPTSSNPDNYFIVNKEYSILAILVLLLLGNYGPILGGWASNNKYALLGAYRGIALSGSYGISIGMVLLLPSIISQSFNILEIVYCQKFLWFIFPLFDGAIFFWIVLLTEIKKVPFDVSESEAELGSGYLIEYSGFNFALFIISEYSAVLFLCSLFSLGFLGGWLPLTFPFYLNNFLSWANLDIESFNSLNESVIFSIKVCGSLLFFLSIRSILPNYRFDYIMVIHWKYIFPLLINCVILNTLLFF